MRRQPKAQTLAPFAGNRGFESTSLHQRVMCEPDFQAVAAGFEGQRNPRETAAGPDRLIAPGQSCGGGIAFVNVETCGRYQEYRRRRPAGTVPRHRSAACLTAMRPKNDDR